MSKGDWRRPSSVPKEQYDQNFEAVFGKKKLNVMSDEDRDAPPTTYHRYMRMIESLEDVSEGPPECLVRELEAVTQRIQIWYATYEKEQDDEDREARGDVPTDGHE